MMKRILVAATTLGVLGTLVSLTDASATAATSLHGLTGAQVDAMALAQMKSHESYTVVVVSTTPGLRATSETSSTLSSGIRHDDINGQRGERLFVNGVVYVYFTATLEKIYFGKVIAPLTHKWVSFTAGQPYFSLFSTSMSETTMAPLLALKGKLKVSAPLTFDAQRVVRVTAANSASGASGILKTLYVADTAPFLPVALVINSHSSSSSQILETMTFKNWGTRVTVTAPRHFTASSKFKLP